MLYQYHVPLEVYVHYFKMIITNKILNGADRLMPGEQNVLMLEKAIKVLFSTGNTFRVEVDE